MSKLFHFYYQDQEIDVLDLLKFQDAPPGIKQVQGYCPDREGKPPDVAYQV